MSLLDDNFDIDIKQLIQHKFKNIFNEDLFGIRSIKKYIRSLFPIGDLSNCKVIIDDFDESDDNEYYIGYDYLKTNDIHRIKIKLFNPKYVVPTDQEIRIFRNLFQDQFKLSAWWWTEKNNINIIKTRARVQGYNICYTEYYTSYKCIIDGISADGGWIKININKLLEI